MLHGKAHGSDFLHLFHLKIDKEMLEVGLFKFFLTLATSLIDLSLIFVLIIQFKYELWQVFGFYFFWCLSISISGPFLGSIIRRMGLKHAIALQSWGSAIFWLGIMFVVTGDFWMDVLWMIPFFFVRAMSKTTSEIAYDIFMVKHVRRKRGEVLAWLRVSILLASLVAPITGAFLTIYVGMWATTAMSLLFFVVAGTILLLTSDEKFEVPYSPKQITKDATSPAMKTLAIGTWGYCFLDCILWILWPVFLIIVLKDLVSLSILLSLASVIAMIMALWTGKSIGKKQYLTIAMKNLVRLNCYNHFNQTK